MSFITTERVSWSSFWQTIRWTVRSVTRPGSVICRYALITLRFDKYKAWLNKAVKAHLPSFTFREFSRHFYPK